jgi:hypothetical protein
MLGDAIPERPHPLDCHVRARKSSPLLGLDTGDCIDAARRFEDFCGSKCRYSPASGGVVSHRDRAAGEQDDYQKARSIP